MQVSDPASDRIGVFDSTGRWFSGEIRDADPQILGWVGRLPAAREGRKSCDGRRVDGARGPHHPGRGAGPAAPGRAASRTTCGSRRCRCPSWRPGRPWSATS